MTIQYVVVKTHLVPSITKGELPDVVKEYLSNTSDIGWQNDYTLDKEDAYVFDDLEEAQWISNSLNMEMETI